MAGRRLLCRCKDPQDLTWWVHLVRPGVESEIVRRERVQAVMLRFHNGLSTHSRYVHPIPPDWRECDDLTLWHYCEQAMWWRDQPGGR